MNTCGLSESSVRQLLKQDLGNKLDTISDSDLELIISTVAKVIAQNNRQITNNLDRELTQRITRGF